MPSLEFEGRPVPIREGDSIASALFRAGVRVFSRSFKYRRRRGLYCLTGDCPNCLVTVDGEPAVPACMTRATPGQRVARRSGWPSPDHDVMAGLHWFKRFLPVGFYYKTFVRPAWLWRVAEPMMRRLAGVGPVPRHLPPAPRERRTHHPALLVIGGGPAGLAAAVEAAGRGESIVLADEGVIGGRLPPGSCRERVRALEAELRLLPNALVLEEATAVGVYEGPLVPVAARDALHLVFPSRVVVATGAVEEHVVFPGSDLPGVWLGRGAARMAGVHGIRPGNRAVLALEIEEGLEHLELLRAAGVGIAGVVAPSSLASRVPRGLRTVPDGAVVEALGRTRVRSVAVEGPAGREVIGCDTVVLALGLQPRDALLRQAGPGEVIGAGEVVAPGLAVEDAVAAGRAAARGVPTRPDEGGPRGPRPCHAGFACLCEDVEVADLEQAWDEGFQSTELLKRYSTATMGPCQGALCHPHLRTFVRERGGDEARSRATTARPPARPVRLEEIAAGARYPLEYHTALHQRHLESGARMEWAGVWRRPETYGDPLAEYWAVRREVSIMDVSTLGKYRVAGPDATEFLERLYPCHVRPVGAGKSRYALLLNEAGYLFDDGLICGLGEDGYYLTFTSGGADQAEGWLRDWAETWRLQVHVANQTATLGAINVAGPRARELLERLSNDPLDSASFPYPQHRWIQVAGVRCLALRVGFTGELSFELHHPRLESIRLWDALLHAGRDLGIRPHGLDALRLLRLEKAHIIVGQDTDFDTTPGKLGLDWAVKLEKPFFIGKVAVERIAGLPREKSLLQFTFSGEDGPSEGAQLVSLAGDHLGYLTSSRFSPALGHFVSMGWVRSESGVWPERVVAHDGAGRHFEGVTTTGPFYDPTGARLRA